jgi:sec-independent protein translocase protein TatB
VFNLSGSELIFLVIIALVVLGPDKLPEAMRKAGKAYADFKKMTTGFQTEMKSVLDEPMRELRETAELAKKSAMFDVNGFTDSVKDFGNSVTGSNSSKPVSGSMAEHTPRRAAERQSAPAEPEPAAAVAAAVAQPAGPDAPAVEPVDASAEPPLDDAAARRLARATPPALNVSTMNLNFGSAAPPKRDTLDDPADTISAADEARDPEPTGASRVVTSAAVAGGTMRASTAPSPSPTDELIAASSVADEGADSNGEVTP